MSAYAQSIQFLLSQVRRAAGSLEDGTVTAYAAGTTTPKTIWLDRGKQTEAANPYTLDANGTAALFGDGLYRFVIKSASGTTVYDRDYISIKDVSSSLVYDMSGYESLADAVTTIGSTSATLQYSSNQTVGSNLTIPANIELMPINGAVISHSTYAIHYLGSTSRWPNAQIFSGTGLVSGIENLRPEYFGAKADGVTNSTAAFNSIIASAASGACNVHMSKGTYLTDPCDLRGLQNVTFEGVGEYSEFQYLPTTVWKIRSSGAVGIKTADNNLEIPVSMASGLVFKNMVIDANDTATVAINLCRSAKLINVKVTNALSHGIVLEGGTYPVTLDHVVSQGNNGDGLYAKPVNTTIYNITNSEFGFNGGHGMNIRGGSTCMFQGVLCQSNGGDGFHVQYEDPAGYTGTIFLERLTFINCYTEGNSGWGLYVTSYNTNPASFVGKIADLSFINSSFNSGVGQTVYMRGTSRVTIIGSPYIALLLDPAYNTVALDKVYFTGQLVPLSGQVQFPAVQIPSTDPNTMDDYEEGTFTPSISQTQTNLYTGTGVGYYQKIGKYVRCIVNYTWTNHGTASNTFLATFAALPYPVSAAAYSPCSIQVSGGSSDSWSIQPQPGTSIALFNKNAETGVNTLNSDMPLAGTLTCEFTYVANQ